MGLGTRPAQVDKAEFTLVNEHFEAKHNEVTEFRKQLENVKQPLHILFYLRQPLPAGDG